MADAPDGFGSTIATCYDADHTAHRERREIDTAATTTRASTTLDGLVAHRGWPGRYPENSLAGLQAVLEAGARWVEFDVQITADAQPVVIHDDRLQRLSGRDQCVTTTPLAALQGIRTVSPSGATAAIPGLVDTLNLVARYPGAAAFVELKRESIRRHGRHQAVDRVCRLLEAAPCPVVFISFDWRAVRRARSRHRQTVGWVFKPWSLLARGLAAWLRPDYLFVHARRVPDGNQPFWRGPWRWVIYGVDDLAQAQALKDRGADLIEVDDWPAADPTGVQ